MGISSFFGKLFGTEKAMETAVKSVRDGLDSLVYTDEEKATDAAKERSEARSMIVQWMQATQGQNLTRRFIALAFTFMFFMLILSGIGLSIAGVWIEDSSRITETSKIVFDFLDEISTTYSVIIAFYFAAPHMSELVSAYTNKKAKDLEK